MALQIGSVAPDFEADTTEGRISFHDWIGDSWTVLFSHPRDFTPICTTELGYLAKIKPDFDARGVKIIGLSVDPVSNHEKWSDDIEETAELSQAGRISRHGLPTGFRGLREGLSLAKRHRAMVVLLFPPMPPRFVQRLLFGRE